MAELRDPAHRDCWAFLTYIGPKGAGQIEYDGHTWNADGDRVPAVGARAWNVRITRGSKHPFKFPPEIAEAKEAEPPWEFNGKPRRYWKVEYAKRPVKGSTPPAPEPFLDRWPELRDMSEAQLHEICVNEEIKFIGHPSRLAMIEKINKKREAELKKK